MSIKTLAGHEVEVLETNPPGLDWAPKYNRNTATESRDMYASYPVLDLRRVRDGLVMHSWEKWGIRADGGDSEIAAALAAARTPK